MSAATFEAVPIANSEVRHLRSSIVEQEYLVKVRLPELYSETKRKYPVLYLLDGDHAFGMATDIVQYLIYSRQVPDLIIVSPAYGSKSIPSHGGSNMRQRDLIPFPVSGVEEKPGGAEYLQFLQKELLPFAESNYRIDSADRTLWGFSRGATFALYALFQSPGLFRRYIAIDGFAEWLGEMAAGFTLEQMELPTTVFAAAPPGEAGSGLAKLVNTLKSQQRANLEATYEQLSDIGHFAVGAEGLTKGLVSLFQK